MTHNDMTIVFLLFNFFPIVIPALSRNLLYISLCFIYSPALNITFSNCRETVLFVSGYKAQAYYTKDSGSRPE
jgi:hypothetical protein